MEREAEQAMKQAELVMKRVDKAKEFLSRAQARATEASKTSSR
jgi:hypothetical protein